MGAARAFQTLTASTMCSRLPQPLSSWGADVVRRSRQGAHRGAHTRARPRLRLVVMRSSRRETGRVGPSSRDRPSPGRRGRAPLSRTLGWEGRIAPAPGLNDARAGRLSHARAGVAEPPLASSTSRVRQTGRGSRRAQATRADLATPEPSPRRGGPSSARAVTPLPGHARAVAASPHPKPADVVATATGRTDGH